MDLTLLFIVVVPGVLLVAAMLWGAQRAERLLEQSEKWPEVLATIVESRVNRNSKGGRWPTVKYSYRANGTQHNSARISFVQENMTLEACEAFVARYPAGSIVTAWYNPEKPGFSVLERSGRPRSLRITAYIVGGLFLVTFLVLAVAR